MPGKRPFKSLLLGAFALLVSSAAWSADDGVWTVGKSSGEVWLTTQGAQEGAQQVALGSDNVLKAGDTIRTGQNGRVLLTRGAETMLIAPNSVVGLPANPKDGMATTILQRAGSILLDVERRNVKHFEVETPYLAAVVKGTQFRVTVGSGSTKVEVSRGQVEVSDFKSGQIAQVTPGQTATSFATGRSGLQLSGSGTFAPIEQGRPRTPTIERVPVPKDGLHAPREAKGSVIRAVGDVKAAIGHPSAIRSMNRGVAIVKHHGLRIAAPIGEVTLNVNKATQGLAHAVATDGPKGAKSTPGDTKTTATSNGGGSSTDVSGGSAPDNRSGAANASASVTTAIGTANASITNVNRANGKDARADGPAAPCGPACAQLLAKLPGGPPGGHGGGPQGGPGGPGNGSPGGPGGPGGPGPGGHGGPGKP